MNNSRLTYRPLDDVVQISTTLRGVFKPVYVDTPLRGDDTEQRTRYQGLFVDGGMLNNYPIHAFDHVESTASPTSDAAFLSEFTYRGQTGDYPIAGNPKLRRADCDCVLGMRLQDQPKKPERFDIEKLYPSDELVLGSFLKDLLSTYMSQSEEGQIRSVSDEERSVELYATVNENEETQKFLSRLRTEISLEKTEKEYSLSVMDFSTPAIDCKRNLRGLAEAKLWLMEEASKQMKTFLHRR